MDYRPRNGEPRSGWRGVQARAHTFLAKDVWAVELERLTTFKRWGYKLARVVYLAGRGFHQDRCMFRASALTYITVFSLVPLLAFSFSLAKGLGAYERLEADVIKPFLDSTFAPEEAAATDEGERDDATADGEDSAEGEGAAEEERASEEERAPQDEAAADEDRAAGGAPGADQEPSLTDVQSGGDDAAAVAARGAPDDGASGLRQAIDKVLSFVRDTDVKGLGAFGLLILMYTVLKLLSSVEQTFNDIWGIRKSRSLVRKFADYLSMVVIVPVLLVAGTTATAAVQSGVIARMLSQPRVQEFIQDYPAFAGLETYFLKASSLLALWIGFAFVYLFMPNTKTRLVSALWGGVVGGTLWQIAQVAHVSFQLNVAKFNAIYSTFAALPIFLFWIYLSWVTVLLGAELAFAHQNEPAYRQVARARDFDHSLKEVVAVRVVVRVARAFLRGEAPLRPSELASKLGVPERTVVEVLRALIDQHVLVPVEDEVLEEAAVVPARDLDRLTLKDVFDALKGRTGPVEFAPRDDVDRAVDEVLAAYERECAEAPNNLTLRELARLPGGGEALRLASGDGSRA
jgi:membrane protein